MESITYNGMFIKYSIILMTYSGFIHFNRYNNNNIKDKEYKRKDSIWD